MPDQLNVYLHGEKVGVATRHSTDQTKLSFRVDKRYTGPPNALSEGFSLLAGTTPDVDQVSNFFGGFLPEGQNRAALARKASLNELDLFGMLEQYGMTMTGAVSVMAGDPSSVVGAGYRALTNRELYRKVRQAATDHDLGNEPDSGRSTIPGFQPKLMLALFDGKWYQPLKNSHSTHIVKPSPASRPYTIFDEYYSHQIARDMKLSSFDSFLVEMNQSSQFLAIERYDRRVAADGTVTAVHQEDAAQILGLKWHDSTVKFQNPKSPNLSTRPTAEGIASIFGTLGDGTGMEVWLQHLLYNVLVGNHDGHAKNVSVIHEAGESWIADLYDAVPILHINDDPSRKNSARIEDSLSLAVGGEFSHHSVTLEHFRAEARGWGMPKKRIDSILSDTLNSFAQALQRVPEVEGASPGLRNRLGYNLDRIASERAIGKPKLPLGAWEGVPSK